MKSPALRSALTAVVLLVLLAGGMIWFVLHPLPPADRRPAATNTAGSPANAPRSLRDYLGKTIGGAGESVVQVQAFLPVSTGCQDVTGLYLVQQARAHPDAIAVRIYDMQSDTGRRIMMEKGVHCAAVMIDGTTRFVLPGSGEKVLLEGPMEPRDVWKALEAQLHRKLGERAPELPPPPEQTDAAAGSMSGAPPGTSCGVPGSKQKEK